MGPLIDLHPSACVWLCVFSSFLRHCLDGNNCEQPICSMPCIFSKIGFIKLEVVRVNEERVWVGIDREGYKNIVGGFSFSLERSFYRRVFHLTSLGWAGGWGHELGKTDVCVVIGGRIKMVSLCSILFLSLPLVYWDAERENEDYDYSLPTGNSALVKSCPIPLTLTQRRLSATLQ